MIMKTWERWATAFVVVGMLAACTTYVGLAIRMLDSHP